MNVVEGGYNIILKRLGNILIYQVAAAVLIKWSVGFAFERIRAFGPAASHYD